MKMIRASLALGFIAALPALACSRGEPRTAFADSAPAEQAAAVPNSRSGTAPAFRFMTSQTGNAARYRVRERLVGHDLPNDAVGETKSFKGHIDFDANGKVLPPSTFMVDAGSFVSDKERRDGYVRGRLLEANQYPAIVLVPTEVRGVALPLPTSGTLPFEMTGNLTVRDVTRPTTWKGAVKFLDGRITGSASTAFTFDDIRMDQPRVPVLLSVADTIRLEIDFDLTRQP